MRPLLGVLFGILEGLWLLLGTVWVQNGARHMKVRVPKAILAQAKVARGSQRLSGFDFETIFMTLCVLFGIFVIFLVREALCMQFGTLTWGLLLCFLSFQHGISTWLQHSIAGCRCFSQSVLDVVKAAPQARPKTT